MKRLLTAAVLVAAMLVPASQATASTFHPKGEYAQFGECPLNHPELTFCLLSESNGGFFTIGKKTVPLKVPQILQGGLLETPSSEVIVVAAANGQTLVPTPQVVPGGLLGVEAPKSWPLFLQNLFNEFINNGATGVTATVELAAPASSIKLNPTNLLSETGTALSLPVKIKLGNAFLGNNCYIGSNAHPVVIDFTSGETSPPPPNKPIHGSAGTLSFNEAGTIITISGGLLVNNSFAAPGANGCGGLFSFLVDPFVNELVGLPAAAGKNTAELEGKIQLAAPVAVKASE